ncbi:MAG: hypothetical protein M0Z92_13685 [Actinomycetota bacterium]|nr:hypothetical protein [Actinomycetota bacterium]
MSDIEEYDDGSGLGLSEILERIEEIVGTAKAMPLSASVLVSRDEVLHLVRLAKERFPLEMREAQWIVRERAEYLDRVSLEAEEIIQEARGRAERMVSKQEIVRQAQAGANRILVMAREDAARLRFDAEDYADQKLAELEIALAKVMKEVQAGRSKLAGSGAAAGAQPVAAVEEEDEFPFDQDAD